ncbi:hypothetical protein ACMFMF_008751 [Clarireedia jacksonii]
MPEKNGFSYLLGRFSLEIGGGAREVCAVGWGGFGRDTCLLFVLHLLDALLLLTSPISSTPRSYGNPKSNSNLALSCTTVFLLLLFLTNFPAFLFAHSLLPLPSPLSSNPYPYPQTKPTPTTPNPQRYPPKYREKEKEKEKTKNKKARKKKKQNKKKQTHQPTTPLLLPPHHTLLTNLLPPNLSISQSQSQSRFPPLKRTRSSSPPLSTPRSLRDFFTRRKQ